MMKEQPIAAQKLRRRWLVNGVLAAVGLLLLWLGRAPLTEPVRLILDRPALIAYIKNFGLLGPAVLTVFQFSQVLGAMIPGHVVVLTAGYLFGLLPGFFFNHATIVAASLLAFFLARRFGRPVVVRLAPAEVIDRWDQTAREHGFAFFLFSYLLPLFPADAMNYVAGLSGHPFRQFLLANLIGRAPATLAWTALGAYGLEIAGLPVPRWVWAIIVLVTATVYYTWQIAFHKSRRGRRATKGGHKFVREKNYGYSD